MSKQACRMQGAGYRVQDTGYRGKDTGCEVRRDEYTIRMQGAGYSSGSFRQT
jgi:hypothetical protein